LQGGRRYHPQPRPANCLSEVDMSSDLPKNSPISDSSETNSHAGLCPSTEMARRVRRTDPLVHSSFREALLVSGIWFVAMIWSVSVCYIFGYHRSGEGLTLVLGFPDWVFWGIVVPWTTCTVVSCIFSALFVKDGDLGTDLQDTDELGLGG
jgi:hypothetical protein